MKKLDIIYDLKVEYGQVNYGAEAPVCVGKSKDLNFQISDVVSAAPADKHYFVWAQEVCMARNDQRLLLMGCERGRPQSAGHYFHVFGADKGEAWHALSDSCVYRGQDSFGLIWNEAKSCFVNYQTTYQPYEKRDREVSLKCQVGEIININKQ